MFGIEGGGALKKRLRMFKRTDRHFGLRGRKLQSQIGRCGVGCLGGAVVSLPFALWEVARQPVWPTPLGWALLAYLGGFVTFVGFVVWFWGLRALSSGFLSECWWRASACRSLRQRRPSHPTCRYLRPSLVSRCPIFS